MTEIIDYKSSQSLGNVNNQHLKSVFRQRTGQEQKRYISHALNQVMTNCRNQIILDHMSKELSCSLLEVEDDLEEQFFAMLKRANNVPPMAQGLIAYSSAFRACIDKLLVSPEFRRAIQFCCVISTPRRVDWLISYPFSRIQKLISSFSEQSRDQGILGEFAENVEKDFEIINNRYSKFLEPAKQMYQKTVEYIADNNLEVSEQNLFISLQKQYRDKAAFDHHLQLQTSTCLSICREMRESLVRRLRNLVNKLVDRFSENIDEGIIYCKQIKTSFGINIASTFSRFSEHITGMLTESGKAYNRAFSSLIYD